MPRIYSRNDTPGTSYDMLPSTLRRTPTVYGPVYGKNADGSADVNPDVSGLPGVHFLHADMPAHYEAGGRVDHYFWQLQYIGTALRRNFINLLQIPHSQNHQYWK